MKEIKEGDTVNVLIYVNGVVKKIEDEYCTVETKYGDKKVPVCNIHKVKNRELPQGVSTFKNHNFVARYRGKFIGSFSTPEKAAERYNEIRDSKGEYDD